LLDEAGLKSALQWCVEGFAQRSGIKVSLDLPPALGRFHKDIETALFRVVQEALTNVHRHSHASEVNIRLVVDARYVGLFVDDNGRGIPEEKLNDLKSHGGTGVGLAGMRERVRDLGGSFGIESKTGTSLKVSIPIANTIREEADEGERPQGVSTA
jgi:signal transduction histidine kinase